MNDRERAAALPASTSYLAYAWRSPSGRIRHIVWVAIAMVVFSLLGGLVVLPITALLPDSDVGSIVENLLPFVGALVLLVVAARIVMRRPLWTFAAPDAQPRWNLFTRAAIIQLVCMAISTAVFSLSPIGTLEVSTPDWATYAAIIPIALVGFAVQTGIEEVVFRGIWPQAVYRFTTHVVIVYGLPALVFASLHLGNDTALGNGAIALVPYFAMAAFWGWVSFRTGSLWTSWGLHWANNVYLVLLIGSHDDVSTPVSGLAFVYAHPNADAIVTTSIAGLALSAVAVWYLVLRTTPRPSTDLPDQSDATTMIE